MTKISEENWRMGDELACSPIEIAEALQSKDDERKRAVQEARNAALEEAAYWLEESGCPKTATGIRALKSEVKK